MLMRDVKKQEKIKMGRCSHRVGNVRQNCFSRFWKTSQTASQPSSSALSWSSSTATAVQVELLSLWLLVVGWIDSWLDGCLTDWLTGLIMSHIYVCLIAFIFSPANGWAITALDILSLANRSFLGHKAKRIFSWVSQKKTKFSNCGKNLFPITKNFNASIIYLLPKQKRIRMFSFKKIALTMIFNVHCLSAHIYLPSCARIRRKNLLPAQTIGILAMDFCCCCWCWLATSKNIPTLYNFLWFFLSCALSYSPWDRDELLFTRPIRRALLRCWAIKALALWDNSIISL